MTACRLLPLVGLFATLVSGLFAATPTVIPAEGGPAILPISGLSAVFPPRGDTTLKIVSSWSLQQNFEGRDVIDEYGGEEKATMLAGTWVLLGFFDAGGPAAVVAEAELVDAWPASTARLWGVEWQARGGRFKFESNELGIKPALVLAIQSGQGPTLLLYHFFLRDEALSREAMLTRAQESPTMRAVFQAYWNGQTGPALPTRNPAVRQRGDIPASRVVKLPISGLQVKLPDDGFVWLPQTKPAEGVDMIYRMAPRLPDITVELLLITAPGVKAAITQVGLDKNPWDPAPANLPTGWENGPTITTSDGIKETTVAKSIGGKVLLVGFLVSPRLIDTGPYQPLLEALAEAVVHPAPLPAAAAAK